MRTINRHLSRIAALLLMTALVLTSAACDRKVNDLSRFEIVTFGAYEQDGLLENGMEPLQWLVLEREGDEVLLISEKGIYAKEYYIAASKQDVKVSWSKCSLRRWLDNTIYATCFSKDEKDAIIPEEFIDEVTGKEVKDYVTILTVEQANTYFLSAGERRAKATEYAGSAKAYVNLFTGASWWWLRDMGTQDGKISYVTAGGNVNTKGHYADYSHGVVRPVIRVKAEALK